MHKYILTRLLSVVDSRLGRKYADGFLAIPLGKIINRAVQSLGDLQLTFSCDPPGDPSSSTAYFPILLRVSIIARCSAYPIYLSTQDQQCRAMQCFIGRSQSSLDYCRAYNLLSSRQRWIHRAHSQLRSQTILSSARSNTPKMPWIFLINVDNRCTVACRRRDPREIRSTSAVERRAPAARETTKDRRFTVQSGFADTPVEGPVEGPVEIPNGYRRDRVKRIRVSRASTLTFLSLCPRVLTSSQSAVGLFCRLLRISLNTLFLFKHLLSKLLQEPLRLIVSQSMKRPSGWPKKSLPCLPLFSPLQRITATFLGDSSQATYPGDGSEGLVHRGSVTAWSMGARRKEITARRTGDRRRVANVWSSFFGVTQVYIRAGVYGLAIRLVAFH